MPSGSAARIAWSYSARPERTPAERAPKERRQNFFHELLPEGRMLTRMAQGAGLPAQDVNQALGANGNQKYQQYGGRASLARIAGVLSPTGDRDSLDRLMRMTVLSVAVDNLDMHAKNISLLHRPDGSMTLAPAYDSVPQAHQPGDGKMA